MITHGDCIEVMKTLPENSVDTCITDPPYHLTSIVKRFGSENAAPAKFGTDGAFARASKGFMGKTWDGGGIAFQPETWQAVFRVLKPGALLLAFGGTRTYHRMVCAIEDAGFEIRDTIAWVYGSGFPKSYDISKGIDKRAGAEREVVGKNAYASRRPHKEYEHAQKWGATLGGSETANITAPSTTEAQLWDGWGTALKPAFEPIVVAMKPIDGTFVNNALTWGVAGLWIDGGRVEINPEVDDPRLGGRGEWHIAREQSKHTVSLPPKTMGSSPQGRFPANFIHDGSDEALECFPYSVSRAGNPNRSNHKPNGNTYFSDKTVGQEHNDSGSAARFFYCAKASRSERNAGLESNGHPTVKPIELMRYLVRLTKTPTGGVVLDPFTGSGTTGIACVLEGREFIGIEREAEYVEIAEKRIAHYRLPILDEA